MERVLISGVPVPSSRWGQSMEGALELVPHDLQGEVPVGFPAGGGHRGSPDGLPGVG